MGEAALKIEVCDGAQMERYIDEWWDDRISYVKYCIGITPTDQQGEALKAMDEYEAVAIKSGHGTGKSSLMSWGIHHYMDCRDMPQAICTAPSKHQLQDVLWKEVAKWHTAKLALFRQRMEWTRERYFHKHHLDNWCAFARTATKENPESLQGIHGAYVAKFIDEGSAVVDAVYDVLDGAHGRYETKEIIGANPTRLDGRFYQIFTDPKIMPMYKRLTFSCLDSLVSEGGNSRDEDVEKIRRKFGEDSNMYRVRVLGEFPFRDGDSFIPFDLVEAALYREMIDTVWKTAPVIFGVDVARGGDDETVIAIRQGDYFHPYHVLRNLDTTKVANYVKALANAWKPVSVFVDLIGWGAGVHDQLYHSGFPSIGVNVAENAPDDPVKYHRQRDELWGKARDWFESRRGVIPRCYKTSINCVPIEDEVKLIMGEWTTPRYRFDNKGRWVIESKDDLKRRNVDSPNRADAHNLTFASPTLAYKQDDDWGREDEYQGYRPLDPETGY